MKVASVVGLILDIIGTGILAWGTLKRLSTWFRVLDLGRGSYEYEHATWYEWAAIQTSKHLFGSADKTQMNDEAECKSLSATFWGLLFLCIGFPLQLLGTICNG